MVKHPGVDLGNSLVAIVSPTRIACIREHTHPDPIYFKLPGGHVEWGESPVQAGAREGFEETGIWLDPYELVELCPPKRMPSRNGGTYPLYVYGILISEERMDVHLEYGDDGEEVCIRPLAIINTPNFYYKHRALLKSSKYVTA